MKSLITITLIYDTQKAAEEFENLSGQQKVQAAVKLVERNHNLNGFDLLVVYAREAKSGSRQSFSKSGVDDEIVIGGTDGVYSAKDQKWILFENTNIELDNNDVPEGLDMVLPDSYLAGMTLDQMGIKGRADCLLSNMKTEME